ncbi:MAG: hypothetical protein COZ86_01540, partial [Candidatus Moranbacteria bacterium CG_4_8_14_3_um_filter_41_13]
MAQYDLKTVAVIGLGYVGLPLAVRASEKQYTVIGFDLDEKKIKTLQEGKRIWKDAYLEENFSAYPFKATTKKKYIASADVHIICVPTPVDAAHHPDLGPVIGACEIVATETKKGALVI